MSVAGRRTSSSRVASRQSADQLIDLLTKFVAASQRPVMLEPGDEPIPLVPGEYLLTNRNGSAYLEAWTGPRSVARRLLSAESVRPGLVDCIIERFGGRLGRLSLLDLGKPQTARRALQGERQSFTEVFRRMVHRQFPGWEIKHLSTEMDLSRSLSPLYPRATLRRGQQVLAVLACPRAEDEAGFLSFGLIWHAMVTSRTQPGQHAGLALFLPHNAGNTTALRLRWLTGIPVHARVFQFNQHGSAGEVDLADLGNLDTKLVPPPQAPVLLPAQEELAARLSLLHLAERVTRDRTVELAVRGLPFLRMEHGRAWLGVSEQREITPAEYCEAEQLAAHLSAQRAPGATNDHPLSRLYPERWLEAAVRANLPVLDATLEPSPVHRQVLTFAGMDRDIVDLLALGRDGRLAVLELKANEDLHLPLQALDYWMRVTWHAQIGELDAHFPSHAVRRVPPRLLLVSPALAFHSTTETILRYFAPIIEVERVGLNSEWRQHLRVVLRLSGAQTPLSHRSDS